MPFAAKIWIVVSIALVIMCGIYAILWIPKSIMNDFITKDSKFLPLVVNTIEEILAYMSAIIAAIGIIWIIGLIVFIVAMVVWCMSLALSEIQFV